MDLRITRKIIDSIHDGTLVNIPAKVSKIFGLHVPESCPGVDSRLLDPENTWNDKVLMLLIKEHFCSF